MIVDVKDRNSHVPEENLDTKFHSTNDKLQTCLLTLHKNNFVEKASFTFSVRHTPFNYGLAHPHGHSSSKTRCKTTSLFFSKV